MAKVLLENVGVEYVVPHFRTTSLLGAVHALASGGQISARDGSVEVAALKGVNIELEDGDKLGILGLNGAGKTTLLQVIAGILPPTEGHVRVEGAISPLLSIHLGLDDEATGYQNIRFRARYMGRDDAEVDARMDDIAAFTELGDYLHLPLKTYSAGMRLRLAFAVATAFEPEILILDEWISAGDAPFRDKAADRLNTMIAKTGIFVMAAHAPKLHRDVCNKGIVLHQGRVDYVGGIKEALKRQQTLWLETPEGQKQVETALRLKRQAAAATS